MKNLLETFHSFKLDGRVYSLADALRALAEEVIQPGVTDVSDVRQWLIKLADEAEFK